MDVVSEAPFRQDSTRFFYKMVGLCIFEIQHVSYLYNYIYLYMHHFQIEDIQCEHAR